VPSTSGGVGEIKGVGGMTTAVVVEANGGAVGGNAARAESDLALQAVVAGRMSRRRITAVILENAGNLIRLKIIIKLPPLAYDGKKYAPPIVHDVNPTCEKR
jgi:hypothetical protein